MNEARLEAALDELVDPCHGARGDWADVMRRAGIGSTRPSRWAGRPRRLAIVALAALALAAVVLVTTGFGRALLGRIDVDFGSSDRAPQVVRWRFEDLGLGVPPRLAPQAIASQARTVGTLTVRGEERTMWVAPTRRGGFCFELERSWGTCLRNDDPAAPRAPRRGSGVLASPSLMVDPNARPYARMLGISGVVLNERIERLTVEFADGVTRDLDFVYVSAPIDAGFFAYSVPRARQNGDGRPRFVVARDGSGDVVGRQRLHFPTRPPALAPPSRTITPDKTRLPARPKPPPSPPLQTAEANGVVVTAGSNGSVLFDATNIDPARRALLGRSAGYSCFELVTRAGVTDARGLGFSGRFGRTVGRRFFGLETPFDGCEIQGSYGRLWPDKLGSHSVIEIPYTDAGRRFFEDRAAARDLAALLRRGPLRRLRRESTAAVARWLRGHTHPRIAELPSRAAAPPAGAIGFSVAGTNVLFRRVSTTGRIFEVVIGPKGGVVSENLDPLALVF